MNEVVYFLEREKMAVVAERKELMFITFRSLTSQRKELEWGRLRVCLAAGGSSRNFLIGKQSFSSDQKSLVKIVLLKDQCFTSIALPFVRLQVKLQTHPEACWSL